jgi:hypothetical protein
MATLKPATVDDFDYRYKTERTNNSGSVVLSVVVRSCGLILLSANIPAFFSDNSMPSAEQLNGKTFAQRTSGVRLASRLELPVRGCAWNLIPSVA